MSTGIWIKDKTLNKTVVSHEGCLKDITDAKIHIAIMAHQTWWDEKYNGFHLKQGFWIWLDGVWSTLKPIKMEIGSWSRTYYVGIYENSRYRIRIKIESNKERETDSPWIEHLCNKMNLTEQHERTNDGTYGNSTLFNT